MLLVTPLNGFLNAIVYLNPGGMQVFVEFSQVGLPDFFKAGWIGRGRAHQIRKDSTVGSACKGNPVVLHVNQFKSFQQTVDEGTHSQVVYGKQGSVDVK